MTILKQDKRLCIFILCLSMLRGFASWWLGLGDDEAYYWDWSRQLAWSYLDHPGMTAWLIKLSTVLLGNSAFAVRLPALVLHTVTGCLFWQLAYLMVGWSAARVATILFFLIPLFNVGGILMVPDAPMAFFVMLAMLLTWQTANNETVHYRYWIVMGVVFGLGLLSKYTMILCGVSWFIFILLDRKISDFGGILRIGLVSLICGICALPIIIWNYQNGWPSFIYHFYARHTDASFSVARFGEFVVTQMIFLSPIVLGALVFTSIFALINITQRKWRFIACFSLPTLIVFFCQPFFSEFKPHWAAPGYLSLLIGCGFLWVNKKNVLSHISRLIFVGLSLLCLLIIDGIFWVQSFYPVAAKVSKIMGQPFQPNWDPSNDLYGWNEVAKTIGQLQEQTQTRSGVVPFLASHRYQHTGQLAFATQQQVWDFSGNHHQYFFMQTAYQIDELKGKDFIYVSDSRYFQKPEHKIEYGQCLPPLTIVIKRYDELAREFFIWQCRDFRGVKYQPYLNEL